MNQFKKVVKTAYDNLMRRRNLESQLGGMEGQIFHIPYFEVHEKQVLRQRPDREELMWEFFNLPAENETELKAGDIVYEVTNVEVSETDGLVYRTNRIFDRVGFDAKIKLVFDFGDIIPSSVRKLADHPLYEGVEGKAWVDRYVPESGDVELVRDRIIYLHEWDGPDTFDASLLNLNWAISSLWNEPKTFEELMEVAESWEQFNLDRERWR